MAVGKKWGFLQKASMYLERRGHVSYVFDKICTVVYVSKTKDYVGESVEGYIGPNDLVVVGLVSEGVSYRGIVPFETLNIFPSNILNRGCKYRVQSRNYPNFETGSYGTFKIENIVPAKSLFLQTFF